MRPHFSALFATALMATGVQGQITITAADNLPAVGDTFVYSKAAYAEPPAGGDGVLFDYSALTPTGTTEFHWFDPSVYSNADLYPTAQMASTNSQDTVFYEVTSAGLERVGELQHLLILIENVYLEITHSNNALDLQLPLSDNGAWSDQVVGSVSSDGETGTRLGFVSGEADGYGSILLPGGTTAEVLRVRTNINEMIQIPVNGNLTDVNHKRVQHDYYAPFLKMPILTVYSDSLVSLLTITDKGIRYLSSAPVGLQEAVSLPMEIGLMPNPADDQLTVNLTEPTGADAAIFITDASGRTVASERMPIGTRRWQLDTDALTPGCYSVTITDRDGGHGSARLVKR